jgi:hypothetical protein
MANIAAALAQVKSGYSTLIGAPLVERLCREAGHEWRDRELDPAMTVALFVQQVMHGNAPCQELMRQSGSQASASAYCQARKRLPLSVWTGLNAHVVRCGERVTAGEAFRWRGHRTWLGDGSGVSMPDAATLRARFGQPPQQNPGCGFPVAHTLMMFDVKTGMIGAATLGPMHTHDLADTPVLHRSMRPGDLLVADTAFGSYGHLALLLQGQMHGLFPMHQTRIVDFRPARRHVQPGGGDPSAKKGKPRSRWIKRLGRGDQLVEWLRPAHRPAWMSKEQWASVPESITVREIRRRVKLPHGRRKTITVVTTLLDPERYPAMEIIRLMARRWDVEINLRHLKTTMGMEVLRCKSVRGVQKEFAVYRLVYNLVCLVLLEAARRQVVEVRRLSFADAWYWLRGAQPGEPMPPIKLNPHRPGRLEPRLLKRRPKKYGWLQQPRAQARKALLQQQLAA